MMSLLFDREFDNLRSTADVIVGTCDVISKGECPGKGLSLKTPMFGRIVELDMAVLSLFPNVSLSSSYPVESIWNGCREVAMVTVQDGG